MHRGGTKGSPLSLPILESSMSSVHRGFEHLARRPDFSSHPAAEPEQEHGAPGFPPVTQNVLPLLLGPPPMSVMPAEPRKMDSGYHFSALCNCLRGPGLMLTCHLGRGPLPQLPFGGTKALPVAAPQNSLVRHSRTAGPWVLQPLCEASF